MEAEQQPNFVGYICKHFVALTFYYETFKPDRSLHASGPAAYSGFVIEVCGMWFWVTAGHCLKQLDENLKSGVLKFKDMGFMDYFNYDAPHLHRIPFTYEPGMGFYIDDEDDGLDFGLIRIDGNKQQLMEANKIEVVSRKNWEFQEGMEFETYKMLGIPETEVYSKERPDGTPGVDIRVALLAIKGLIAADVPEAKSQDWFAGQIDPAVTIATIKGMSGGPIFGFRRAEVEGEERWMYHVVAVQSWWDKGKRLIFGCSLPRFAEMLYHSFEEHGGDS